MNQTIDFDDIEIGTPLGPWEIDVTSEAVADYRKRSLWDAEDFKESGEFAPSGIFFGLHVRMLSAALGGPGSRIWAKSGHEFIHPIRVGSKLIKRGIIADKYVKREKRYIVYEVETVDNNGISIMKSRETTFFGPDEPKEKPPGNTNEKMSEKMKTAPDINTGTVIPPLSKTAYMPDFDYPITAIHDDDYAKSRGFRGNLVGGSFLIGYVLQMLYRYFGQTWMSNGTIDVSFIGAGAISGDAIEANGTIIEKTGNASGTRLFLDVRLDNFTTGKKILAGKASCFI